MRKACILNQNYNKNINKGRDSSNMDLLGGTAPTGSAGLGGGGSADLLGGMCEYIKYF